MIHNNFVVPPAKFAPSRIANGGKAPYRREICRWPGRSHFCRRVRRDDNYDELRGANVSLIDLRANRIESRF
ncbi:MAG: hypothetical protein ACI8P0_003967 [Planctomycetaceae bacterium]